MRSLVAIVVLTVAFGVTAPVGAVPHHSLMSVPLQSNEWVNRTFFARVQKTSGSSFARLCAFQADGTPENRADILSWCGTAFSAHWDLPNIIALSPSNAITIVWFRETVSRVISEFHYVRRQGGAVQQEQWDYHPGAILTRKLLSDPYNISFVDFVSSPFAPCNNRATRYIGDSDFAKMRPVTRIMLRLPGSVGRSWPRTIDANEWPHPVSQEAFENAKSNLRLVSLIGIMESYEESCSKIAHFLGWRRPKAWFSSNTGAAYARDHPRAASNLSDNEKAMIRGMNSLDVKLYELALDLFHRWN